VSDQSHRQLKINLQENIGTQIEARKLNYVSAQPSAKPIPVPVSLRNTHQKYFLYLRFKKVGKGQKFYTSLKIELPI
jgi:hypothetical protein